MRECEKIPLEAAVSMLDVSIPLPKQERVEVLPLHLMPNEEASRGPLGERDTSCGV